LSQSGYQLVNAEIQRRLEIPRMPRTVRLAIELVGLSTPNVQEDTANQGRKPGKRCAYCPREKDIKTTRFCNSCNRFVCKRHSSELIACLNCQQ
jgi:hypothetical protein